MKLILNGGGVGKRVTEMPEKDLNFVKLYSKDNNIV